MTYLVYDLAVLAILLFFVWLGARRGLVLTLCSLLAVFVALIGASFLSDALAEPVAKAIEPAVARSIHDQVSSYWQRTPEADSSAGEEDDWLSQLPLEELLEPLRESRFFQGYVETFQQAVDDGVARIVTHAAQALARYVAVQIARTVIFVLAFFAILMAWWFLSHALDLVARLPVLSTVNRWGGGIAGFVKGALVLFIAGWLLKGSLPPEAVRQTVLLKFFCTVSPLSFFL